MKKGIIVGVAALMVAGIAGAQDDMVMVGQAPANDRSRPEVTVEAALVSSYVWRGQVYNNDFVIQPQITIEQYGVSFNIWGNYDLGNNVNGISGDFSEIDMSLAYSLPLDINQMAFDVGIIGYDFPANGDIPGVSGTGFNSKSTTELFASATVLSWQDYVIPSFTLFGDIDEAKGAYFLFDIVAPYEVSEYLAVEGGISAGYGNTSYNDYYFSNGTPVTPSSQDAGWNDFNFYGNVSYLIQEGLTLSANLTYTTLEGGSIKDAAGSLYEAKEKVWGGVNIAYDF